MLYRSDMTRLIVLLFVLTYLAIVLEHPLKVNKAGTALIGAGLLWTLYALLGPTAEVLNTELAESLTSTAQIVFFLIGAMAIVEVVDAHDGFEVLTARINTQRLSSLVWLVGIVTFFLSAVLDNLTTTIVMVSLMKRLLGARQDRLLMAGIIVIAANAGGPGRQLATSPRPCCGLAARSRAWPSCKAFFWRPWSICWCHWPWWPGVWAHDRSSRHRALPGTAACPPPRQSV